MQDQEPGPSSAFLAKSAGQSSSSTSAKSPRSSKSQFSIITEMKQVSPTGSNSTTPTSSFGAEDGKKVVYSIFPPLHDHVIFGLTRRQLLTLVMLAVTEFLSAQVYSIQGPYYPEEAVRKLPATYVYGQIGCVFGIFELAVFIFIPLFGKMMQNDGTQPKLLFHSGVFITAVSTVIFSFLEFVPTPMLFLICSLVLRAVQGIGEAAILSSACALLTMEFPNSIATTFSSMQTFYALGLISGPVFGGSLMDVYDTSATGKFALTFLVFGCLLLVAAILGVFILPSNDNPESFYELDGKCCFNNGGFKVFHLFRAPSIALVALTVLSAGASVGFNNAMLEPHIHHFLIGRSYILLAGFFIITGGICGLFAPGFHWITEKLERSNRYFIILGSSLIIGGFILIGPATFVNLEKSLIWIGIGLFLQGLGLAAITVASFKLLLHEAINNGYADNINSYGLVSTFWTLTFCFGCFLGSCISGILFDIVGFSTATWFIIGLHILVTLLNSMSIIVNRRIRTVQKRYSVISSYENREDQPLLTSDSFYKSNTKSYS